MKAIVRILALVMMTYSVNAFADEVELARLEKNMSGGVVSISLIGIDRGHNPGEKMMIEVKRVDGTTKRVDISQFQKTVNEILGNVSEAVDPIVTKNSRYTCRMMPFAEPELLVDRLDRSGKTNTSKMEVTLTNVGCAHESRLAPKSDAGEASARILYQLLLDGKRL